jgi:hypothetical protein
VKNIRQGESLGRVILFVILLELLVWISLRFWSRKGFVKIIENDQATDHKESRHVPSQQKWTLEPHNSKTASLGHSCYLFYVVCFDYLGPRGSTIPTRPNLIGEGGGARTLKKIRSVFDTWMAHPPQHHRFMVDE